MFFHALAADFDGTLANHGLVDVATLQALKRLKETGRRILLVTGREMADLKFTFTELHIFDRIVAENGGVLYDPASGDEHALAPAPPAVLIQKLMEGNVEPISVGKTIVATWQPHDAAVLSAIAELGLELQIVFNKGAIMILPTGINKACGLRAALEGLGLSPINVAAVGDAENDHAFLKACGFSAAVANALPAIKAECDISLCRENGVGVSELIERLIAEESWLLGSSRLGLLLGVDRNGEEVHLMPQQAMLIAGGSGSGKSNFATLLTERMIDKQFQFCVIDPEGDYHSLEDTISTGASSPASIDEVLQLLRRTTLNLVVNTLAVNLPERRWLFERLLPLITSLRATMGRPHWLLVDEAHHFLPRGSGAASTNLPEALEGTITVTVEPRWLPVEVLRRIDILVAFGVTAPNVVAAMAAELGSAQPTTPSLRPDEALFWSRSSNGVCRAIKITGSRQGHERHKGKYAVGDVGEEHSFYFLDGRRGARRARNLAEFIEVGNDVPDAVWNKHLRDGDFAAWFANVIRDEELARQAGVVANDQSLDPRQSRERIMDTICQRYVIPK